MSMGLYVAVSPWGYLSVVTLLCLINNSDKYHICVLKIYEAQTEVALFVLFYLTCM